MQTTAVSLVALTYCLIVQVDIEQWELLAAATAAVRAQLAHGFMLGAHFRCCHNNSCCKTSQLSAVSDNAQQSNLQHNSPVRRSEHCIHRPISITMPPPSVLLCFAAAPQVQPTLHTLSFTPHPVLPRPLFWAGRAPLTLRDCLFCAVSGLRGSISLILAQAIVTEVPAAVNSTALVRVPCWTAHAASVWRMDRHFAGGRWCLYIDLLTPCQCPCPCCMQHSLMSISHR